MNPIYWIAPLVKDIVTYVWLKFSKNIAPFGPLLYWSIMVYTPCVGKYRVWVSCFFYYFIPFLVFLGSFVIMLN